MSKFYEITVFDTEFGDEGLDLRATSYEKAEALLLDLLNEYGWDNVTWDWNSEVATQFEPEVEIDDCDSWDSEIGFDPYCGSYTYDC